MSTEKRLQKNIEKALITAYPNSWIFHPVGGPYQMTGVPDILALIDGVFFGIEVKHQKPGESLEHAKGRASPGQLLQIQRIREAGGYADVVTSVEETVELVRNSLAQERTTNNTERRNYNDD